VAEETGGLVMASRRKPGLWFGPRRIEVEDVKKAHKKKCSKCDSLPEDRRLKITDGSGRHAVTSILCIGCGERYLRQMEEESRRAQEMLCWGEVRGPEEILPRRVGQGSLSSIREHEYKHFKWPVDEKGIRL